MHDPRVIGITTRKVQMFFGVQTVKRVKDLDANQVDFSQKTKLVC